MGRIGPRQQRFEVLPVPAWDVDELIAQWRADAAAEPAENDHDLQSAADDR